MRLSPISASHSVSRHRTLVLLYLTMGLLAASSAPHKAGSLFDLATPARAQAPDPTQFPRGDALDPANYAPVMPTQPQPAIRGENWAGGQGPYGANGTGPARPGQPVFLPPSAMPPGTAMPPNANGQVAPAGPQQLENAIIVARVGLDVILASDMLGRYSVYLAAQRAGAPPEALAQARKELAAQLKDLTDVKLLFLDAAKTIPADPLKDIESKITDQFDNNSLKDMMERAKATSKEELDVKLREMGTSVERRRRAFYESSVAKFWLQQQVKVDDEVPYTAILAYYQENLTKFDHPGKAQWEELTVKFANFSDRDAAMAAIVQMGNDVFRGVPLAQVAKAGSQGPTATGGGFNDWTTQGSLKSTAIDAAIFSLPVGRMSQIVEDADGYHIVRVVKRNEAGRTPFSEAQSDIKKQLKEERTKKKQDEYLAKLREKTPVWTIFDNQPAAAATAAAPRPEVFR
jgi:parvulin-like peptidyl-prolyl isomerase